MKKLFIPHRSLQACVCLALCFLSFTFMHAEESMPELSKSPLGDIKAFQVRGNVDIFDGAGNRIGPLKRGQVIQQGKTIKTSENSSTLLMFSNGSTINLGGKSILAIEQYLQEPFDRSKGMYITLKEDPSPSKVRLYLQQGELIGNVQKLREDSSYEVETPVGVASIRGTVFFVSFGLNKQTQNYMMQVSNFEGKVIVDTPLEAKLVMDDGGIAAGKYNPYTGPQLYEVPEQSLIIIEADRSLGFPLENPPIFDLFADFDDFAGASSIQGLIGELQAATGITVLGIMPIGDNPTLPGQRGIENRPENIISQ